MRYISLLILLSSCLLPPRETNPKWFLTDYQSSRNQFIKMGKKLGGLQKSYHIESQSDADLTIDQLYLPAADKKNLVIFFSGTHGVEGLTGSAVQRYFLEELYSKYRDQSTSFLFLHSMNPWGFKNMRRVDEKNVDLNRNYEQTTALFKTKNDGYSLLNSFLNPSQKVRVSYTRDLNFYIQSFKLLLKNGIRPLRQAILMGQYHFPEGVYFGGFDFSQQRAIVKDQLIPLLSSYKNVLLIDLHTGYGKRGTLHLLADVNKDEKIQKSMVQTFQDLHLDFGNQKDFYTIHGSFVDYVASLRKPDQVIIPIVFEYGTLDSQTSMGGIKSLHNTVLENQLFWHGAQNKGSERIIKSRYREMFYPSSPQWRHAVLNQTKKVLSKAIPRFKTL